jgi:hypothetical protein
MKVARARAGYTPAVGKLAAAMATIWAKRRPIRDDAERKNEFTCRISPIPRAPAENSRSANKGAQRKMVPAERGVEGGI